MKDNSAHGHICAWTIRRRDKLHYAFLPVALFVRGVGLGLSFVLKNNNPKFHMEMKVYCSSSSLSMFFTKSPLSRRARVELRKGIQLYKFLVCSGFIFVSEHSLK